MSSSPRSLSWDSIQLTELHSPLPVIDRNSCVVGKGRFPGIVAIALRAIGSQPAVFLLLVGYYLEGGGRRGCIVQDSRSIQVEKAIVPPGCKIRTVSSNMPLLLSLQNRVEKVLTIEGLKRVGNCHQDYRRDHGQLLLSIEDSQ